jgi:hypothetical protein
MNLSTRSQSRDWETTFSNWTGPASDSEQARYEWTRRAINDALRAYSPLATYTFNVYPKGSYPAYTNVVLDSDVDVAAELTELFKPDYIDNAEGLGLTDVGATPYLGEHDLPDFKDHVERALIGKFGIDAVRRGNKAIHVRQSTQALAADVVPCVTSRTYTAPYRYFDGIALLNDARPQQVIENFPKQHILRGTEKNDRTLKRYKRIVRILKRLENEMVDEGLIQEIPSFLIESAVWNVPDSDFVNWSTWTGRIRAVLRHIFNGTLDNGCVQSHDWMEANNIKYLFHGDQAWSYRDAHEFADRAWDHIGFG